MFGFGKDKIIGEYVKYSKRTAKANPEMIDREFTEATKKVNEEIDNVEELIKQSFIELTISISDFTEALGEDSLRNYYSINQSYSSYERSITVSISKHSEVGKLILGISPEILSECEERINTLKGKLNELQVKHGKIVDEHRYFWHVGRK